MTTISHLLTEEAQITLRTRTGAADDFGTPTLTEADPVEESWHFQPAQSEEFQGPSEGQVTWVGYGPANSVVDTGAKIITAVGREFEVVGPPRPWTNPRTVTVSHVVVNLVEVT